MDALKRRLTDIVGQFSSPLVAAINYPLSHWGGDYGFAFFHATSRAIQKCAKSWWLQF
jgi:hypothetical protein